MNTAIKDLLRILPPPEIPVHAGSPEDWPAIESAIGFALPADYKQFINLYGSGGIDDWIFAFSPFFAGKYGNLQTEIASGLAALREIQDESPQIVPYPIHPEPGGLVPWACTSNGDILYWITRGPPAEWTVCVNEGRGPEWEAYPYSMVAFLVKLMNREIRVGIFPEGLRLGPGSRFVSK